MAAAAIVKRAADAVKRSADALKPVADAVKPAADALKPAADAVKRLADAVKRGAAATGLCASFLVTVLIVRAARSSGLRLSACTPDTWPRRRPKPPRTAARTSARNPR